MAQQSPTMEESNDKEIKGSFEEDTDLSSSSMDKSRSTNFTFDSIQTNADLRVDKVDKNHYLYRQGSTKVHVQSYDESLASDIIGEDENSMFPRALSFISAVLGLIIVVITLVIKVAAAISPQITSRTETEYMMVLFICGFVWLTFCTVKGTCLQREQIKFLKSNQSSNRWLKGVVVLFGLAIVLKDGLEFIAYVMVNTSVCTYNQLEATTAFFHALFILSQVKYLFKYSKVYIRNHNSGSRTGIMFIIAINLSSWIAAIVDETLLALQEGETVDHGATGTVAYNDSVSPTNSSSLDSNNATASHESEHSCTCHSAFCTTVHTAETFLFPFLVEFSLVASSLLFVTWENIGKKPPSCEKVIKPSYKFYNKYIGASFGGIALFVTIIILILLGTFESNIALDERSYYTESRQLIIYDAFLMGFEFIMLIAIFAGFYLFYHIRRPLEKASLLDQALLVICILGPLVVHMFSMVAVIEGNDNKTVTWIFTVLNPLVDVIQSVCQLLFILYGLKREPITSASAKETTAQLSFGIEQQRKMSTPGLETLEDSGEPNNDYLKIRRSSITSVVSRLANPQFMPDLQLYPQNIPGGKHSLLPGVDREVISDNVEKDLLNVKNKVTSFATPEIVIFEPDYENEEIKDENNADAVVQMDACTAGGEEGPAPHHSIVKIVSETKVARPHFLRIWLRDVIFFLLMANACLWVFQSLDGTAFTVYQYESLFYGYSAWTTIKMICRPLSIFFRMHSAGCLFEMWSFA